MDFDDIMVVMRDFREWLGKLESEEDLVVLKDEVMPEPDIGAIGRAICDIQGPAVLMKSVKGYDMPVAIGVHAAWRRVARALGLANVDHDLIMEAWRQGYKNYPLENTFPSDAPCKQNVMKGDDVNLFKFPLHRLNLNDGSFFISKGCVITKHPDTKQVNVGIYRMMIIEKDKTAMMMNFDQHGARHFMLQEARGQPLEVAVSIGNEPILPMVAGSKIPYDWSEFEFTGAIRGSPYELVQAETVDLPVPARAEIILEGKLIPGERTFEGPFGEFPGAYTGYFHAPVFKLSAITYRDDPIYESLYIGRPNSEPHYMTMHSKLAGITHELKQLVPKVTKVSYLRPYVHMVVIQGRWDHTAEPKQAINALWGTSHGSRAKITVCVDEDVDPWSAEDVMWAVTTRVSSADDIIVMPGSFSSLDPAQVSGMSIKIGIDATKPRPPHFRYSPLDWVEPPEGTERWRDRILEIMRKGNLK